LFEHPPAGELLYTDDTQMTLGVAECMLARGTIDPGELARRFWANYEPWRGYGPCARKLLDAMKARRDWQTAVPAIFPGVSLGNGAAMRADPSACCSMTTSTASATKRRSAAITYTHPIGIDGAVIIAVAVALAVRARTFDRSDFFGDSQRRAATATAAASGAPG
jgi:poly(ADP-ribose) glycohydrolase ARH3